MAWPINARLLFGKTFRIQTTQVLSATWYKYRAIELLSLLGWKSI